MPTLDDVLSDYLIAEEAGQAPSREELLRNYPELADALRSALDDFMQVDRLAAPLRHLAPPSMPEGGQREFGDFELLEELGRGGMGVVYRARQKSLNRLVAVKMLLAGRFASADAVQRFATEAEAAANLDHSGIVAIHDVGDHEGQHFYSMALVEGRSLLDDLRDGPLPPRRAADVVRRIAAAVSYAHERGVIHRDLKPANILLDDAGEPRITDFGLAKLVEHDSQLTATGQILGTPSYMPPEQCRPRGGDDADDLVGPSADIYALGAILYALLVGRPPFQGPTPVDTMYQVVHQDPVPPRRLNAATPADLQTIALRCLAKDPQARYESAAAMADELTRWLKGEPILARPASVWERAIKWSRRKPAQAMLLLVCGLALIGAVSGVVMHNAGMRKQVEAIRRQKQRADSNYRSARDALSSMLSRLDDHELSSTPKLLELRRKMLEDALHFYEAALTHVDDPDAAIRADAALAYHQAGTVQVTLGQPQAALRNFRKAIRLLDALHQQHPEHKGFKAQLSGHLANLGITLGTQPEALIHLRRSLTLRKALYANRAEGDLDWRDPVATSHHSLGAFHLQRQEFPAALAAFQEANRWRQLVKDENPQLVDAAATRATAETLTNLGLTLHGLNRGEEAGDRFAEADRLFRRLLTDQNEHGLIAHWAANLVNWGNLLRQRGALDEASQRYTEGIDRLTQVVQQEPTFEDARQNLLNCHGARALLRQQNHHQFQMAAEDWRRVVELANPPRRDGFRVLLAYCLALGGDAVSVERIESEISRDNLTPGDLYNLACAYALSGNLTPNQSIAYRDRAFELLQLAKQQAYFADAPMQAHLKADSDLNSLHDDPRWLELLRK